MTETKPEMPGSGATETAWEQALDWLMRVGQAPEDAALLRRRDRWIAERRENAQAYRKAEKIWRLTGDVRPSFPIAPPHPAGGRPTVRPGRGRTVWTAAATAALAACLALFMLAGPGQRLLTDHHTGTGERARVALPDGSTVDLDAETAVDVAYAPDRRQVHLVTGRAFFDVKADRARPFVVATGETEVTVTGTSFDVRTGGDTIGVRVKSGTVSVAVSRDGRRAVATLARGETATVSRRSGTIVAGRVAASRIGLWREGRLAVDGATVGEVVRELRRYYRGVILISDDALENRRVTGVFNTGNPVAALETLMALHGGTVREITPYVLIASARS